MHFHIPISRFRSPCYSIICLNPCFSHKLIVKQAKEMPSFFLHVIGKLLPPPHSALIFPPPILSTPLDFNRRYSRGPVNECCSLRVHPKVTHLKPRTARGKNTSLTIMWILTWLSCPGVNVILYIRTTWEGLRVKMNCCIVSFNLSSRTPAAMASLWLMNT